MAIASNFPAIKPSLSLDFANTKRLDSRVTFTRTTTATYYDGVTTAKAEENLLLYSQVFDNAYWDKISASVSANAVVAPDGTSTAETITFTGAGSNARITSVNSVTNGATYTFSVFLKGTAGQTVSIEFDTAPGTTVTLTSTWARYTVTNPATASTVNCRIISRTGNTATVFDAWGAQLEQRSSVTAYTATTTQPITNYIPVLLTAASGVARFQHNPTTDESLGLLIEEQRTNLFTYSAQFDNAAWLKIEITVSANQAVAPDGTLSADQIVESTTALGSHVIYQVLGSAAVHTLTVYAKPNGRSWINMRIANTSNYFDIGTGALGTIAGGNTASITSVGNGWYRCSVTATMTGSGAVGLRLADANNSDIYTGNGYSGIFLWGAQLEAGAFPTSYIATTSATVTRNADAASMTGSNFTSWYNQGEGAVYTELSSLSPLTGVQSVAVNKYPALFVFESGTTDTNVLWYGINAELYIGGAYNGLGSVPTGNNKLAVSFSTTSGQGASSLNGAAAASRSGALTGTATRLGIGSNLDSLGTTCLNGTIKKLAYYPLRLTNAQLQALTS